MAEDFEVEHLLDAYSEGELEPPPDPEDIIWDEDDIDWDRDE